MEPFQFCFRVLVHLRGWMISSSRVVSNGVPAVQKVQYRRLSWGRCSRNKKNALQSAIEVPPGQNLDAWILRSNLSVTPMPQRRHSVATVDVFGDHHCRTFSTHHPLYLGTHGVASFTRRSFTTSGWCPLCLHRYQFQSLISQPSHYSFICWFLWYLFMEFSFQIWWFEALLFVVGLSWSFHLALTFSSYF